MIILHISAITAIAVDCVYGDIEKWPWETSYYTCNVTSQLKKLTITEVNTAINSANANKKKVGLFLVSKESLSKVHFFPIGLDDVFPNLKAINIEYAEMKEIHQKDLKPFADLEMLNLCGNRLEYLEEDLFAHNIKLKAFAADHNKIAYIDPNIFDNLKNLSSLALVGNFCKMGWILKNRTYVENEIAVIKDKCSSPTLFIVKEMQNNLQISSNRLEEIIQKNKVESSQLIQRLFDSMTQKLTDKLEKQARAGTEISRFVDLNHQNASSDKLTQSKLDDALMTKNVSIYVVIPLAALVTILNIFLIISCFRKKLNVKIQSSDAKVRE